MTDLETSMATIIAVFQKYSKREGDAHKLKKSELRDLLHDELPDLMGVREGLLNQSPGGFGKGRGLIPAAIATNTSFTSPAVDFQNRCCCFTDYSSHTHTYINIYN